MAAVSGTRPFSWISVGGSRAFGGTLLFALAAIAVVGALALTRQCQLDKMISKEVAQGMIGGSVAILTYAIIVKAIQRRLMLRLQARLTQRASQNNGSSETPQIQIDRPSITFSETDSETFYAPRPYWQTVNQSEPSQEFVSHNEMIRRALAGNSTN